MVIAPQVIVTGGELQPWCLAGCHGDLPRIARLVAEVQGSPPFGWRCQRNRLARIGDHGLAPRHHVPPRCFGLLGSCMRQVHCCQQMPQGVGRHTMMRAVHFPPLTVNPRSGSKASQRAVGDAGFARNFLGEQRHRKWWQACRILRTIDAAPAPSVVARQGRRHRRCAAIEQQGNTLAVLS